ncbi:hypothetical protein HHK36_001335 [Tetracentron sinense]|uniref:Uncharacterized protein n=1 Tax=Tetracentron sinense TaxID=13715 RepID=A0A834ZX42_TETSI|nr:hypothetical protein HHK36_001335 [Tetracentron sinense]
MCTYAIEDAMKALLFLLCYSLVTYQCFHWKKGTPFAEDQGIYNGLTWWEQMDNGKQLTRNRKFLTVVPIVLWKCGCVDLYRSDWIYLDNKAVAHKGSIALILLFLFIGLDKGHVTLFSFTQLFFVPWYLIASHTTDYQYPMLFLNTLAVFVLVVAKFPNMHKVRIFGINADH